MTAREKIYREQEWHVAETPRTVPNKRVTKILVRDSSRDSADVPVGTVARDIASAISAEPRLQPRFRIRSRTPLFERGPGEYSWSDDHRMYDVASDDQRFIMVRRLPSTDSDMILVENFFKDVAEKMRS